MTFCGAKNIPDLVKSIDKWRIEGIREDETKEEVLARENCLALWYVHSAFEVEISCATLATVTSAEGGKKNSYVN